MNISFHYLLKKSFFLYEKLSNNRNDYLIININIYIISILLTNFI